MKTRTLLTVLLVLLALAAVGCTEKTYITPTEPGAVSPIGSCTAEGLTIFCNDGSTGTVTGVVWDPWLSGVSLGEVSGAAGKQTSIPVNKTGEYIVKHRVLNGAGETVKGSEIPVTVSG